MQAAAAAAWSEALISRLPNRRSRRSGPKLRRSDQGGSHEMPHPARGTFAGPRAPELGPDRVAVRNQRGFRRSGGPREEGRAACRAWGACLRAPNSPWYLWAMNPHMLSAVVQPSNPELLARVTHLAELHLSEHAAYGRIAAARAVRRFPIILERLGEGSVTLTTVGASSRPLSRPRTTGTCSTRPGTRASGGRRVCLTRTLSSRRSYRRGWIIAATRSGPSTEPGRLSSPELSGRAAGQPAGSDGRRAGGRAAIGRREARAPERGAHEYQGPDALGSRDGCVRHGRPAERDAAEVDG